MSRRIELETLVQVFEKRIEALEKNPPELVPTAVIIKMLERAIHDVIYDHFEHLIRKEIKDLVTNEFKKLRTPFVKKTVKQLLSDELFRQSLEDNVKKSIINGIKKTSREYND